MDITLRGPDNNINALGAKIFLFTKGEIRSYEKYPVRGFMSSAEIPLHIGLFHTPVDSAFLVWPDNTFQPITLSDQTGRLQLPRYTKGLPRF